ncbi:YIPF3-like protein [Mya arenaria]|uniref:Protein YIPF3 n=1 Tax=Mya arenaria TaxID=6604 RepID=A0ABY7DYZ9_MYAAR|nr:YIPF3-like protein [Mya arenaria]
MADTSHTWKSQQNAVVDLDDMAGSDHSDYETSFSPKGADPDRAEKPGTYMDSMKQRLLMSFMPQRPTSDRQRVPRELYGPFMIIFTLIALLLFQMKTAEHRVEEGTLMGTAFGVCFTYWLGASGLIWVLSYVCNTHLALIQILSMMGYGLGSHCLVIFLGTIIHTSHDHLFFYSLWAVLGGLSTLRMVSIILSRTHGQTQRLIVCGAVTALNLLFLLYLHFAYHQIVEDLSEVFASHDNQQVRMVENSVVNGDGSPAAEADVGLKVTEAVRQVAKSVVQAVNETVKDALVNEPLNKAVGDDKIIESLNKAVETDPAGPA